MAFLLWSFMGYGQEVTEKQQKKMRPFVAYELGEAAFNKFQSISGEVGVKFRNDHLLRLTHMNVNLTEAHLSSDFVVVVDGSDVEGKMFGFEVFYDFPVLLEGLHLGPSFGYYINEYNHTVLDESVKENSATIGLGISYREENIFGLKGLYYTLSLPLRIHFDPMEKTKLGDTTIYGNQFDSNIWFFVGYQF